MGFPPQRGGSQSWRRVRRELWGGCGKQHLSCNSQLRPQGLHPVLTSLHLNLLLWLELELTDGEAVTWPDTAWEPFVMSTVFCHWLLMSVSQVPQRAG